MGAKAITPQQAINKNGSTGERTCFLMPGDNK
jgi:hypothetical protein